MMCFFDWLFIVGLPVELESYESEHSITDSDLKALLNSSANPKASKKKKKKSESNSSEPQPMECDVFVF